MDVMMEQLTHAAQGEWADTNRCRRCEETVSAKETLGRGGWMSHGLGLIFEI